MLPGLQVAKAPCVKAQQKEDEDEVIEQIDDVEETVPAWATFDNNVESYWELLEEMEVDMTGRESLYHLGKLGEQGHYEAMLLIRKLEASKWKNNIQNPSKFIHKASCNAINKLNAIHTKT